MQNTSGISPLDVKVLILPDPVEEKTSGGVYLADTSREKQQYAAMKGTVVEVGANAFLEWGAEAPKPVPGSRIVTAQYAGLNIEGDDKLKYRIVNDDDLIAVLAVSNG